MSEAHFSPSERQKRLQDYRDQAELWHPTQFAARAQVAEQFESLWGFDLNSEEMAFLREMEALDEALCTDWVNRIRSGERRGPNFRKAWDSLFSSPFAHRKRLDEPGYDDEDLFANRLLTPGEPPDPSQQNGPGMVYFQKTPVRIVRSMAERVRPEPNAMWVDLGSGFGQAPILFHLLTGMKACGIEIQHSYCDYSRDCARQLGLPSVDFIERDLREADLSQGTIFFMYSPVEGDLLQNVVDRWCRDARPEARLFSYGPCNEVLLRHPGLAGQGPQEDATYTLCEFAKRIPRA